MTQANDIFDYIAICKAESEILVKLVRNGELTLEDVIKGNDSCTQKYDSSGGCDSHSGASWYYIQFLAVEALGGDVNKIFINFIAPLPQPRAPEAEE